MSDNPPPGLYILHTLDTRGHSPTTLDDLELWHIHPSDLSVTLRSLRASIIAPRRAVYSTMSGQRFEPKNMLVSWALISHERCFTVFLTLMSIVPKPWKLRSCKLNEDIVQANEY